MPVRKKFEERADTTQYQAIQYFGAREEEILRRHLAGDRNDNIARDLKLSEARVSTIINSPLFQKRQSSETSIINEKFKDKISDPVTKIFRDNAKAAANKIVSLMKISKSESLQHLTAKDVLGYSGHIIKSGEDHSTKIFIEEKVSNDIYVALQALDIKKIENAQEIKEEIENVVHSDRPPEISEVRQD
jgi:TRAP-type mannitol/chloroaromatic compound transport system substrate-binding protein